MSRKPLFSVTIEDCEVQTFCAGGKGGQHQNATQSAVRIIHKPSGAVGECREERHQWVNKQRAFRRMAESKAFQLWARRMSAQLVTGKTVEQHVEEAMVPGNIKIERRGTRGWETWESEDEGGE